ncbi:unnamed protein product [Adineta steineri]|uniref:Uncharacterized protein n=1 Tax=Adineta steineri TaxID=433720 RepID=A0A814J2N9_9BILA|nr:unnamed protein product [Adineta steineri]CAF1102158.1 unnamed protein product [Adineta steineri]CAF1106071.1 unnamed protein product [Adineta steineri]
MSSSEKYMDPTDEKVPVVPVTASQPIIVEDYKDYQDIRRTRGVLIVLIAIQLVFAIFYFIERTIVLVRYYNIPHEMRGDSLSGSYIVGVIVAAFSVVYYNIFIIVVAQYRQTAILIFSWLGLIQLIFIGIIIALSIIAIVAVSTIASHIGTGIVISIIIIIIAGLACILTILTVICGFRMVNLLKMHGSYQLV